MNFDILETKKLISEQIEKGKIILKGKPFYSIQKTYFSTNENIKECIPFLDVENKSNALTVLGSGDHAFNLIKSGILNIDTFDCNKISQYYVFGLKRAMILKYSYEEFLNVIDKLISSGTTFDTLNDILYGLLPYIDSEYRNYWKTILDFNYKIQKNNIYKLNLIQMMFINVVSKKSYNNYLLNEIEYNKLKSNIGKSNINYKNVDAINLHKEFDDKYDIIMLSNILDYFSSYYGFCWDINILSEYVNNVKELLNDNGIMLVNYIFNYYYMDNVRRKSLIRGSCINYDNLTDYKIKKLKPNGDVLFGDGVIIYNKK